MKNEFIYFKSHKCSVCQVLFPKIKAHAEENYPLLDFRIVQVEDEPEVTAQLGVFTAPVLLVVLDGKEQFRLIRNFSTRDLDEKLERPYRLIFQ